jgi:uncharacterized protein YjbI with pentapeptide repeats
MANPEHLAKLREDESAWNAWRKQHPDLEIDLSSANLDEMDLSRRDLRRVDFSLSRLIGASLAFSDLSDANLFQARLISANLTLANLRNAQMSSAMLRSSNLAGADLRGADLNRADLSNAKLAGAKLSLAKLIKTDLSGADLRHATMTRANLSAAKLNGADLGGVQCSEANLTEANLQGADLKAADLWGANLTKVDFRSSNLQRANLNGATTTGVKLWEAQRAGWSILGILCERAFWDKDAIVPTAYTPGEFERLYSDQTCIELFYAGGVSTFELNTLPALLQHLASLHPDTNIRLKSIEETGGGAKISISVGDADTDSAEKVRADAMQVYQAQLVLRDKETERLQIERDYLERLFLGKLVPAMLSAGTPRNVFNAPVNGVVIASGDSRVDFRQTVNDNSALLALLERMADHRADLNLPTLEARAFESQLQSTTAELQKPNPDKSVLLKGVGFLEKLANEAFTRAAGKLGEAAITADWQSWLHQLGQFVLHL